MFDRIKEIFSYREDGYLLWKAPLSHRVKIGAIAGTSMNGYMFTRFNGKRYGVHQLIFAYHHGYLPENVDHIDRNPSNNRIDNLRAATSSQNHANSQGRVSRSGYRGVYMDRRRHKWFAQISVNGKSKRLGSFLDARSAAMTYDRWAVHIFGEFAQPNFPTRATR